MVSSMTTTIAQWSLTMMTNLRWRSPIPSQSLEKRTLRRHQSLPMTPPSTKSAR